jgi:hypothetical protein
VFETEAWARMLLALEQETDDIEGERAAVLAYIAHYLKPKEPE